MQVETIIVGNLVKALDDARLFCVDASTHATRPWLKRILEQLAQTHLHVADELCAHARKATGTSIPRDGSRRRTWRAGWLGWVARNHFDSELVYVQQAKKYEDRLARRFARAARRAPAGEIQWCLKRYLCEIDHARAKITRVAARVQEEIDARWLEADGDGGIRATAAAPSPRMAGHDRSHAEAPGCGPYAGLYALASTRQLH